MSEMTATDDGLPHGGWPQPGDLIRVAGGGDGIVLETGCGPLGRGIRVATGASVSVHRKDLVSLPATDPGVYRRDRALIERLNGTLRCPADLPPVPAHILAAEAALAGLRVTEG